MESDNLYTNRSDPSKYWVVKLLKNPYSVI